MKDDQNKEDKLYGTLSDTFLASKILSDPNTSEFEKEIATRLLAKKAMLRLRDVADPFGFTPVSNTGAGPLVQKGDQILSLDGIWRAVEEHEVGTAIDR